MRRRSSRPRVISAVSVSVSVAVAAAVSLGLPACGSPRTSLGTDASACFRALPVARQAVHERGRLVGVRRVSAEHALRIVPHNDRRDDGSVCLIGFHDSYDRGNVDGVVRVDGSKFAIVAVALDRRPRRLGTLLTDQLPERFSHL
jgi:hypothetical protein